MEPGLVLLGTIHCDPLGFRRLRRLLSEYRPDLILVELSPFALEYRRENSAQLARTLHLNLRQVSRDLHIQFRQALRHPRIRAIGRQIGLPFEYRAAAAYARDEWPAEIVPVDSSEFSREWIAEWPELISRENLRTLLELDDSEPPEWMRYEQAARIIRREPGAVTVNIQGFRDLGLWRNRERQLAVNTLAELERKRPVRPIYVGGWRHLVAEGEPESLRSILQIDLSRCLLLDRGWLLPGS